MTARPAPLRRVVIIGGSYAGVGVASDLRDRGFDGEIILLGAEPALPYHRTHLSKESLTGDMAPPRPIRPESFYAEHAITLLAGVAATAIDRAARSVLGSDGIERRYDALVLATGAKAARLPARIDPDERALTLRDARDRDTLAPRLRTARQVVCIGGGLIGLELAAAARSHGCEVAVIEVAPGLMARSLYPVLSAQVLQAHSSSGIAFRLGVGVARVDDAGIHLANGTRIAADLVVSAIGSTPRVEIAATADLECLDGILTDAAGRTSDSAIYALGDNACWAGTRHESVAAAQSQARAVAAALLGIDAPAPAPLRLWSTQGALRLQMSGPLVAKANLVLEEAAGGTLLRAYHSEKLVSVQGLNAPRAFAAALAEFAGTAEIRASA